MSEEETGYELVIAGRADVQRAVAELAHRVVAELGSDLEIVGIRQRGVPLAHFIAAGLAGAAGATPRVHEIGFSRNPDEAGARIAQPKLAQKIDAKAVRGRAVLLVDDLRRSGRTLLSATAHLLDAGAARVSVAVLVGSGRADVPIEPDFCGFHCDVGDGAAVEVHVPPYDEELQIAIVTRG